MTAFSIVRTLLDAMAVAVPMRTGCPASAPSPKKSPGTSIATTASLPIRESTDSLIAPLCRYLTSLPASPCANTTCPRRYFATCGRGPSDVRYVSTSKADFGFRTRGRVRAAMRIARLLHARRTAELLHICPKFDIADPDELSQCARAV